MSDKVWVVRINGLFFRSKLLGGMTNDINLAEKFDRETALFLARPYPNAEVYAYRGF